MSVFGLADVFHGTVGRAPLLASLEMERCRVFRQWNLKVMTSKRHSFLLAAKSSM